MPIKPATFTADNIVALLEAAPHGGTIAEVITRSGASISEATVSKWIKDGNR